MCDLCGCRTYISSGKEATVNRAQEIIRSLGLTAENVELFEDCERILHEVFSYSFSSSEQSEMLDAARWAHSLHESIYKERFPKYVEAAKDVFARLPVNDNARTIVTVYHQLEQLAKEIGDKELALIEDARIREAVRAVRQVHDNNFVKKTRLREYYGLE
jgi:4'-phosphopantetheinyl transferase EntD